MGILLLVLHSATHKKQFPLHMDLSEGCNSHQHAIDIGSINDASPSSMDGVRVNQEESHHNIDRPIPIPTPTPTPTPTSNSTEIHLAHSSSSSARVLNPRDSSIVDRNDSFGYTSPLNSGMWISVELIVTLAQIVASAVILSLQRYKSSEAPLFAWVVGYACGCLATLPILYWRLQNCTQNFGRTLNQSRQSSSEGITSSVADTSSVSLAEDESHVAASDNPTRGRIYVRLNGVMDHFKMALDCFFAVWFVVGNVWIFGAHSSPSVAPKLYRLCIVFLTFSCIGYALPFLLCATIFCCLPCIVSVMGIREDHLQTGGATTESINALPTYKCKLLKHEGADSELFLLTASASKTASKSGFLFSGAKERTLSREDAVCCICLSRYVDNDELRELPCSHLFHSECVDKWLKVNASCPLCKLEVVEGGGASSSASNSSARQHNTE